MRATVDFCLGVNCFYCAERERETERATHSQNYSQVTEPRARVFFAFLTTADSLIQQQLARTVLYYAICAYTFQRIELMDESKC